MTDSQISLPSSFSSRHPVLLFPVRLQAKFVQHGNDDYELRIRIYPDQLDLSTHEEELTFAELDDGKNYWSQPHMKNSVQGHNLSHWRTLVAKYGSPRARWILRKTTPTNLADLSQDAQNWEPRFADVAQHSSTWTRAALSLAMPERFTVVLYNQYTAAEGLPASCVRDQLFTTPGLSYNPATVLQPTSEFLQPVRTEQGKPINIKPLSVGFDPTSGEKDSTTGVDENNLWTVDFDKALENGMAITVKLSKDEFDDGFKRLVVLGVKEAIPAENQKLLEQILNDHKYTDGLAIVPQGTPTNNTDTGDAGFSSLEHYDADASFELLLRKSMFEPVSNGEMQPDGQRLTQALGIDPEAMGPIAYGSTSDISDAQRMNKALWPATYGYFLDEMLRMPGSKETLLSKDTMKQVREFFESYVLARGPVPAFRVGNEPYGILPTTRFSTWKAAGTDTFGQQLADLLNQLDVTWTERLNPQPNLYPTQLSTNGSGSTTVAFPASPSSQQELLTTLAADATSVEYYQRYLLGPVLMDTLSGFSKALGKTIWANNRDEGRFGTDDVPENPLYKEFRQRLDPNNHLKLPEAWPKIFDQTFQSTANKLASAFADEPGERRGLGLLIDEQPLSEAHGLAPLSGLKQEFKDLNYIRWLAISSFDEIRLENFSRVLESDANFSPPNSLLYHLLRQAVLLKYWEIAREYKALPDEQREEKELFNIMKGGNKARWEWLYHKEEGQDLHYLLANSPDMKQYLASLHSMAAFSTAHLERLLAEHIDLGSYRIDAWKIALVTEQLVNLRQQSATKMGAYLGTFAWLEEVQHTNRSMFINNGERYDPDNLGYIHAPSLNHGTAAAILRQGYKSRQMTTDETNPAINRMGVDLSSTRIRKALAVLEGLRNGQSLGAVLGQEFERNLQLNDATVGGKPYGSYVASFRKIYPIAQERVLSGEKDVTGRSAEQESRQVLDGLALLRATPGGYPYEISGLPTSTSDESVMKFRTFVAEQLASLTDTLDALGDLAVSEGVYQAALGNTDRAAAVLESVAKGQFPVNPEIVHPPHRGNTVTHRVLLHFPSTTLLPGWTGQDNPRVMAEPYLNAWLAQFFSVPDGIKINYRHKAKDAQEWLDFGQLALQDSGLHPIDLLILLDGNALQANSTFDLLLRHAIGKRPEHISMASNMMIEVHYERTGGQYLRRLLPLINRLRQLLSPSRSALPNDLKAPGTMTAEEAVKPYATLDFESEVKQRLSGCVEAVKKISQALASIDNTPNGSLSNDESAAIWDAVLFGVPEAAAALPALSPSSGIAVRSAIDSRMKSADEALTTLTNDNMATKYVEAVQALFGPAFRLSIDFTLPENASIRYKAATTAAARVSLMRHNGDTNPMADPNPLPMQEWLQGIACVRETMDHLDKVLMMQALLAEGTTSLPQLQPAQLASVNSDYPDNAPYWLGKEWPKEYKPAGDAISLVQWLPDNYSSSGAQHALCLDEWTETIADEEETTALTFHYDQPNTEPPQTLLLVVPSSADNAIWEWEDLLGAVNETLDMAKKRTVEPDSLAFTHLSTLLPAIVSPVAQQAVTFALDFGHLNGTARFKQSPLTHTPD